MCSMAGRFGRNDAAIAAALEAFAQAVGNQPVVEDAASRSLATFQRENPPTFKGVMIQMVLGLGSKR